MSSPRAGAPLSGSPHTESATATFGTVPLSIRAWRLHPLTGDLLSSGRGRVEPRLATPDPLAWMDDGMDNPDHDGRGNERRGSDPAHRHSGNAAAHPASAFARSGERSAAATKQRHCTVSSMSSKHSGACLRRGRPRWAAGPRRHRARPPSCRPASRGVRRMPRSRRSSTNAVAVTEWVDRARAHRSPPQTPASVIAKPGTLVGRGSTR